MTTKKPFQRADDEPETDGYDTESESGQSGFSDSDDLRIHEAGGPVTLRAKNLTPKGKRLLAEKGALSHSELTATLSKRKPRDPARAKAPRTEKQVAAFERTRALNAERRDAVRAAKHALARAPIIVPVLPKQHHKANNRPVLVTDTEDEHKAPAEKRRRTASTKTQDMLHRIETIGRQLDKHYAALEARGHPVAPTSSAAPAPTSSATPHRPARVAAPRTGIPKRTSGGFDLSSIFGA